MDEQRTVGARRERSLLVHAWGEESTQGVRASVTAVDSEERRVAGSLEAMHKVIDDFLTAGSVILPGESDAAPDAATNTDGGRA